MKIKRVANEPSYWDEGNKTLFRWYKKGAWKRIFRKRWLRKTIKSTEKE